MKQHITKEQWNELSEGQRMIFITNISSALGRATALERTSAGLNWSPTIGQMIEFLGDDLKYINYYREGYYSVKLSNEKEAFDNKEPIDAGWEAVKYKLK